VIDKDNHTLPKEFSLNKEHFKKPHSPLPTNGYEIKWKQDENVENTVVNGHGVISITNGDKVVPESQIHLLE